MDNDIGASLVNESGISDSAFPMADRKAALIVVYGQPTAIGNTAGDKINAPGDGDL